MVTGQHEDEVRAAVADLRGELSDDFWRARPVFEHIRQAAHARQRSATAVLHVVLARVAAAVPHGIELPPIVGAPAPLCYFPVLIATPGVGKSSANTIGAELLPLDPNTIADQLPLGSGEGLAEVLFGWAMEPDPETGKPVRVKKQVRFNAFVYVDEGKVLADLSARRGSVLAPTLRTIWSGGTIGQTNASDERRRIVPAGQYSYGVVLALQDEHADALLGDAAAGTPQRFAWARATDPTVPDDAPEWPGPIKWHLPVIERHERNAGGFLRHRLTVAPAIVTELRQADLARVRGIVTTDTLDAHGGLLRLKVAALLAILDGRLDLTDDDWYFAGVIKASSDAVRDEVVASMREAAAEGERKHSAKLAERAVTVDSALTRARVVTAAEKLAEKVHAEPDRWTVAAMRRAMRNYRVEFTDALDHALGAGWVTDAEEPGQGEPKRRLLPGLGAPR